MSLLHVFREEPQNRHFILFYITGGCTLPVVHPYTDRLQSKHSLYILALIKLFTHSSLCMLIDLSFRTHYGGASVAERRLRKIDSHIIKDIIDSPPRLLTCIYYFQQAYPQKRLYHNRYMV